MRVCVDASRFAAHQRCHWPSCAGSLKPGLAKNPVGRLRCRHRRNTHRRRSCAGAMKFSAEAWPGKPSRRF